MMQRKLPLVMCVMMQLACSSIPDVAESDYAAIKDEPTRTLTSRCRENLDAAQTRDSFYGLFTTVGTGVGLIGTVFATLGVEYGKDTLIPVVSLVSTSLSFLSQVARGIDTGDTRDVYDKTYIVGIQHAAQAEEAEAKHAAELKPLRDENISIAAQLSTWQTARERLASQTDEAGEKASQIKDLDGQIAGAQAKIKENEARIAEINADAIALRKKAAAAFTQCDDDILF